MKKRIFITVLLSFLLFSFAHAEIVIHLKKSFVEKYRNRVTIEVTDFIVVKAHKKPNPPSKDGDMHVAGKASEVGLPVVAEIMNAAAYPDAVKMIHDNEGTNQPISVIGVWRIWCEHAGEDFQTQGEDFTITNTNPPHVFQIHPVTRMNDINLLDSLRPVYGFKYKNAEDAFYRFENAKCELSPEDDFISITTSGVGYNYVDFKIELNEDPYTYRGSEDGRFVFCKIMDLDDEIISQKERIAFVRNSKPDVALEGVKAGDVLRVIGIPRLNLNLVHWRVDEYFKAKEKYEKKKNKENERKYNTAKERLTWKLPYEMVIAATVE
jgi:hypothetical protein